MTIGINDTKIMRKTVGKRIKEAREKLRDEGLKVSREKAVKKLNESHKAPYFEKRQPLSPEVLRRWETGENSIEIEWIPAICDVYKCDVGYLFGEYQEHDRDTAFIVKNTGLSEAAVTRLQQIKKAAPLAQGISRNGEIYLTLGIVSEFIESETFLQITNNIGLYLLYRELSKDPIRDTTLEEYTIAHEYAEKKGAEIVSRKNLCEMYLQTAADYLKEMARGIHVERD